MRTLALLPLYLTQPPYSEFIRFNSTNRAAPRAALAPGSVLAVWIHDSRGALGDAMLSESVDHLRRCFPGAAVIVCMGKSDGSALRVVQRAAELGIRAILLDDEPLSVRLRAELTRPERLGSAVVDWFRTHHGRLSLRSAHLVREIIDEAGSHSGVGALLRHRHESEITVRRYFRRHGLPPPRGWYQLGRGLNAARLLQAEPQRRLINAASELGYVDEASLSRHLHRTFGARPPLVRAALGWEWLVERWFQTQDPLRNVTA